MLLEVGGDVGFDLVRGLVGRRRGNNDFIARRVEPHLDGEAGQILAGVNLNPNGSASVEIKDLPHPPAYIAPRGIAQAVRGGRTLPIPQISKFEISSSAAFTPGPFATV